MDIAFANNYAHILEVDITPTAATRTWAWVGPGISNMDPNGNEKIDQSEYYDGGGMAASDVTGGQLVLSVSGHRRYGDPFQDFVASLSYAYAEARKTRFRLTNPDGRVVTGKCTLANIKAFGPAGDANAKSDFSVEIHCNGIPDVTEPDSSKLPESVTLSAVAVTVGATVAATATVTPTTASGKLLYAVEDPTIATVDADGNVTGVAQGETGLTVKCAAKPSVLSTATITVSAV